tara:strand:+ start:733 stop:1584 length:852 start_codon:yes stop_codon:yes gene_type:complete
MGFYFRELPDIEYTAPFKNKRNIAEFSLAKNIFKRPVLRDDIKNSVTAFTQYEIRENERPDQVSEKFYGTPDNEWVILLVNNIHDLNSEWPLDNESLYSYMIDKYGSEEALQQTHHFETKEFRDEFDRLIIREGIQIDTNKSQTIDTNTFTNSYRIDEFPSSKGNTVISINLNQRITIFGRDITSTYNITDIQTNISKLKVRSPDGTGDTDINVLNSLAEWPSSWGGTLTVNMRDDDNVSFAVDDIILDNKVEVPERLYEITGSLDADGVLQPTFNFTNEIPV